VRRKPYSVVLFDEVESSSWYFKYSLYRFLEDGD
jgi:ATP-dependent Clp protease ATP-binding subunit ClpA